jgi:hypothetical protein
MVDRNSMISVRNVKYIFSAKPHYVSLGLALLPRHRPEIFPLVQLPSLLVHTRQLSKHTVEMV